jgi:hypothetical protein
MLCMPWCISKSATGTTKYFNKFLKKKL